MRDCTAKILSVREFGRHTWNTFYRQFRRELDWEDVDDLDNMMRIAFRATFDMLPNEAPKLFEQELEWLKISALPEISELPLLVRDPTAVHIAYEEDKVPTTGFELQFVSLYDFDSLAPRDFHYLYAMIAKCEGRRELQGRYALVPLSPLYIRVLDVRPPE